LKYCGTDIPRKSESPVIMRFRIEFIFVNWRNEIPTDAARGKKSRRNKLKKKRKKASPVLFYRSECHPYQQGQKAHSTMQQILGMEWMQIELQIFLQ